MERRHLAVREERFRRTRADLATRLRHVCAEMEDADRDALLDRMATIQILYMHRRSKHIPALAREAETLD